MTTPPAQYDPLTGERLVVVTAGLNGTSLLDAVKERFDDWHVVACDSYLSAIAEVARHPTRGVIAYVAPSIGELDNAVAGLRRAAGSRTRVVLCCRPESEPLARRAVAHGANDYVLYPLDGDELDAALGYGRPRVDSGLNLAPAPPATTEELVQLSSILESIGARPMVLLEKLAVLLRTALKASGATVIVEGAVASSGDVVTRPVLTAPITSTGRTIGHVTVGKPMGEAYTPTAVQKLTHYAVVASHILQAASRQRRWQELAMTDECSGLPNRRYVHQRLDEILRQASADKFLVTVLLFDLDDFKNFNDRFGHDAGDEIIRITGRLFEENSREQDIVARYGGDEFLVVFWDPEGPRVPGSKHPECALAVLERFKEALKSQRFPKLGDKGQGSLTISGGLATYPWDGITREDLLKQADNALLAAKRAGKNRVFLIGHRTSDEG